MRRGLELNVLECPNCGGRMRFVAAILTTSAIRRILRHLGLRADPVELAPASIAPVTTRGPPLIAGPSAPQFAQNTLYLNCSTPRKRVDSRYLLRIAPHRTLQGTVRGCRRGRSARRASWQRRSPLHMTGKSSLRSNRQANSGNPSPRSTHQAGVGKTSNLHLGVTRARCTPPSEPDPRRRHRETRIGHA
jgi:hypothetical protein